MKYIQFDNEGSVYWDEYFDYIKSIADKIPAHVYAYAKNFKHYSLSNKESLHDAWLNSFTIEEKRDSEDVTVALDFLGAYHDRILGFRYTGVCKYELCGLLSGAPKNLHGDVFVHEVRESNNMIEHEIVFSTKSRILIECKDFVFQQVLIKKAQE